MKKIAFLLLIVLITCNGSIAQVGINDDGSAPNSSAGLDVKFDNKGFLPPRMTTTQRDLIPSPATGLIIFNTDCDKVQYYNATGWKTLDPDLLASVMITSSSNPVVAGTSVTFTAAPVNGGTTPQYQWKKNGSNISGATNITYTYAPLQGDQVCCVLTSNVPCGSGSPATSNVVTMTVYEACGNSFTIGHIAGTVAPVTKTVTYGTVTGIPGEPNKCWITSNLGSDHQATAVNDATEASAGWYWQFNRKQGYKHDGSTITPAWTITSIVENSEWLTTNDPCNLELGTGWRLPTYTEWYIVDNVGGWTNWNGPWNSDLKLHAAGYPYPSSGTLGNRGVFGVYWSSSQNDPSNGCNLCFDSYACGMNNYVKAYGFSVRCVR